MPFQSKESVGLSPLLTRILVEIEAEQADPGLTRKALAVAELSRLFTKERDTLGTDYLHNSSLAAAYLSYFFPVNLSKIQVLLDELPEDWQKLTRTARLRCWISEPDRVQGLWPSSIG